MASVRKRILPSGKVCWLVCYNDQAGHRRAWQFELKASAVLFETKVRADVISGTHIADRASISIREAGELWLKRAERENLERGTIRQYEQHLRCQILPLIGEITLSRLTAPTVEQFRDDLLEKCSRALTRAVLTSLKGILKEARRRGLIGHDPASGVSVKVSKNENRRREIPTKDQIRAILHRANSWPYTKVQRTRSGESKIVGISWRAFIVTAVFTGMRCSELRGLTWDRVDWQEGLIQVRQRADFQNTMGPTKTYAGDRDIPMAPLVMNTLKSWQLICPNWPRNLVFPTENGTIHSNGNIHRYCWGPLLHKLGIVKPDGLDNNGSPRLRPALTFHSLRHAAASLFIEQGWTAKKVQVVMGHSNIAVTFNTYGHLWKDTKSDLDDMAQLEARLLA